MYLRIHNRARRPKKIQEGENPRKPKPKGKEKEKKEKCPKTKAKAQQSKESQRRATKREAHLKNEARRNKNVPRPNYTIQEQRIH